MSTSKKGIRWFAAVALAVLAVVAIGWGITWAYAEQPQYSTDLRDHVKSVEVTGATYDEQSQTVSVRPDAKLSITLAFSENGDKKFHREKPLTYALPAGFDYGTQNGTFPLRIDDEGKQVSMNVPYKIENGMLTVTWPQDDPNYRVFAETANAEFNITFDAVYQGTGGPVDFGNRVTRTFKLDTSHSVGVQKSGQVGDDGKIHYTVTVTSTGQNTDVRVRDAITGTALTYDEGSFAISGNSAAPTGGPSGNGFDITLPSLKDGEVATITYTASIDYSKITNGGDQGQTENGVSVTTTDQPTPQQSNTSFEHQIDMSDVISKSGTVADRSDSDGHRDVMWTIDANSKHVSPLAGKTVTDRIDSASQGFMRYSGDGIKVEVFEKGSDTPKETRTVSWSELDVDPSTASTWSYRVPSDDGNYEYRISYSTNVGMKDQIQGRGVKNHASIAGGPSASAGVNVPSDFKFEVQKTVKSFDAQTATWQITANVPKQGYSKFVMTDTLPTTYLNGKNIYDQLVDGSIEVEGLQDGESYAVDSSDSSKVVLTFYQDSGKSNPGLDKTASDRTIAVTLKTQFNAEWLAAVDDGTAAEYQKSHENNVNAVANNVTKSSSATVTPPLAQSIKKSGAQFGTANINGTSLPIFRYQLVLTGVPDADLDIDDIFDNDLTYCGDPGQWDANLIFGGNQWDQGNRGLINPTFTVNGDSMHVHVPKESLPKSSGSLYSHYKIVYYLVAKDQNALKDLQQRAAQNEGVASLGNTAKWGGNEASAQVEFKYEMLDKQLTKEPTGDDRKASYELKLNPGGADLDPNGDTVTLTDQMTNQELDLSSVKVTALDGKPLPDDQIHYDYDNASGTFTLTFPDGQPLVLTYDTVVTGAGTVTYSNTATLQGQSKGVSRSAQLSHGGGGSASILGVKLLKHEKGDDNKPLSGATFKLYKAPSSGDAGFGKSEPVTDKTGNEVSFTSDEKGIVTVEGHEESDGWVIDKDRIYYLVETHAPAGYKLDATPIRFAVSDTPDGKSTYSNGYELGFANEKEDDRPEDSVLPVFGGPGDTMLYVIGGLLAVVGGAGLLRRRLSS